MLQTLQALLARARAFVAPFHDPRAWTLIAICAGIVFLIDPVMVKTVAVWSLQAGIFVGLAVIGSRHILPQINLADHVAAARAGNVGAGLVVLTVGIVIAAIAICFALFAPRI